MSDPITLTRVYRGGKYPNFAWVIMSRSGSNQPVVSPMDQKPDLDFLLWKDVKEQMLNEEPELHDRVEAAMKKALNRNRQKRRRIKAKITITSMLPRPKSKAAATQRTTK